MNEITYFSEFEEDFNHNGLTLYDFDDEPEVTRVINNSFALTGSYQKRTRHAHLIKEGAILRAYCPDRKYQLFRIVETKPLDNVIQFVAFHIAIADAARNFIIDFFEANGSGSKIMSGLQNSLAFKQRFNYSSNITTTHQFTAKEGNPIAILQGSNNGGQNLVGVTSGELDFDNFDIKLLDRIGIDKGFRIDFRINLESVESLVDAKNVVNSLYLIGETPEGDYDQEQEPIKYFYLERPGLTDKTRRIGKRTNSECKTEKELVKWGNELFDKDRIHEPKATHIINMIDLAKTEEYQLYTQLVELNIGDTVHARLDETGEEIEERLIEYTWLPRLGEYQRLVLGNDLTLYTNKTNEAIRDTLKELEIQSSILNDKILNATNLITGTSGGHVVFRPKNKPSEILIMDSPDVNKAKEVWRWNLGGLGHSKNGVNGPFTTAMTSDGQIVANIITAGTFNAEMLRVGFNGIGDTLQLVSNALQIWNNKTKIMELTKKGLEFWRGKDPIGEIGTTGDNFSWIADVKASDRSLFIGLYGGDFIKIANDDNDGMYLPSKKYRDLSEWAAPLTLYCKKGIDFQDSTSGFSLREGNLHVPRKLFVGGKEVTGGGQGGGGGWNGQYPPEVTSQADKFAWQLWIYLIGKGYSPASAAGILGNVQGEVGNSMNPDTEQVGGPAYGAVQWDGSAYPLVGPVTWNGREYVKMLMGAASIKDNYTTMIAQSKLIDWCMYNEQWIGAVQPTTVNGFKGESSPENAALAFELNFERPAAAHPERQGYARNWYNKFKDLKAPEVSGNFIPPISAPITVTSEWGYRTSPFPPYPTEFHNGMDFVNGNPNTPIYASMDGEVVVMGNYPDWYGLYVVIKHANGKYTGYAHNSSVRVAMGDIVTQGQQIANMGTTGPSTAEHCHFQIMNAPWPQTNEGFENPRPYIFG